ncbi:SUR7/PalI family-domain-containing protein [Xylariaceae sp. FL1272]|nr:SUR7/PalI family-domain-containing protein [Xylariaceae sp. FL1272]
MAWFRKRNDTPPNTEKSGSVPSNADSKGLDHARVKKLTSTRRHAIIVTSVFYLLAVVFFILVEIGNTSGGKVLGEMYFYKLDLTNIFATASTSTLTLQNSIARTLGLHDFYQVGLWNFCEGYNTDGITHCSKTNPKFWFDPVAILLSELFSGASIALPSEVNEILYYLRLVSHIMFGFFLVALILDFILIFLSPIVLFSRWWSLPMAILSFLAAALAIIAAGLGTAVSFVFKYALSSQPDLGVTASVGTKMLAFEWIAAGFTLLAFFIHAGLSCCCTSRRDLRTGRKGGKNLQHAESA